MQFWCKRAHLHFPWICSNFSWKQKRIRKVQKRISNISLWNSATFDRWTICVGQVVPEIEPPIQPFRFLTRFTLISVMTKNLRKNAEFRGSVDNLYEPNWKIAVIHCNTDKKCPPACILSYGHHPLPKLDYLDYLDNSTRLPRIPRQPGIPRQPRQPN